MPLSLTTQWTLVASGLMAHADHVITGEECEHLMTLVDIEADGDAYAKWMGIVSDRQQLSTVLDGLALPPPESHRQILEDAWLIAVLDGERVEAEVEALRSIATRLGVEPAQLEQWREAWTTAQHEAAKTAVAALAYVLGGGAPVLALDQRLLEDFVQGLATTHEHREQLVAAGFVVQQREDIERQLRAMTPSQHEGLLRRLASPLGGSVRASETRECWRQLGRELGLADDALDELADG